MDRHLAGKILPFSRFALRLAAHIIVAEAHEDQMLGRARGKERASGMRLLAALDVERTQPSARLDSLTAWRRARCISMGSDEYDGLVGIAPNADSFNASCAPALRLFTRVASCCC